MRSALSPNVVKTALDKVFWLNFSPAPRPDHGSVLDPQVFNQLSSDRSAEIIEELKSGGYWDSKNENQNVPAAESRTGNQFTYTHTTFAQIEDIPKEFFDDDQHGVVQRAIREMAINGRQTREREGMGVFRGGFSDTYGDSAALFADSHSLLSGDTQDNKLTAALAVSSLEDAIKALSEQKSQAGVIMGVAPRVLLVPPALYKPAVEITESKLVSDSAENAINVFSSKYGLIVKQSPFLGAATSGGSDTAWFLLGEMHGLERYEREGVSTTLMGWEDSRADAYSYKARFRESTGASSHIGIVGSNGTT